MTSVPKPLKFLRPHWQALKEFYAKGVGANKVCYSDVLSVLSMTMAEEGSRDSLTYRLLGGEDDVGTWGHEYVRNLSGEVAAEFVERGATEGANVTDLMTLVDQIVPFHMKHNAEPEACDLLMEVDRLNDVLGYADDKNFARIGLYLQSVASYKPEPEDSEVLTVACTMYRNLSQYTDAMRMALRLNLMELATEIYTECQDTEVKKQLAIILGRQQAILEEDDDELQELIFNTRLSEQFLGLARDLEVLEPKTPEEIYKSQSEGRTGSMDSARANLASTFVNAFVNAGYAKDKLMQIGDQDSEAEVQDNKWLFKNKEHGMMSAAASVGMLLLWDIEQGLNEIDRYLHDSNNYIQAGALLAMGIVHSGVRHDCDPAKALLSEYLEAKSETSHEMRLAAIAGLGIAYAGTFREDLMEDLMPNIVDSKSNTEILGISAIGLSLVYVGTCNMEVADPLVAALLKEQVDASASAKDQKKQEKKRDDEQRTPIFRFIGLGLGIVFLGKKQAVAPVLERLAKMEGPMAKFTRLTVETCAYAGSGDVDTVHKLLGICGEHPEAEPEMEEDENEKKEDKEKRLDAKKLQEADDFQHQFVATIGIGLVSMAEDIGAEMTLRMMTHLQQYGEIHVRRAVPITLGLSSVSNPELTVTETLGKLTHDSDGDVAMSAIFALGLVGAGTNNSRVAGMLRGLASYYARESNHLFIIRISLGLLHMGKEENLHLING
jgi:26S proteasome regulatory subunit N1